MSVEDVGSNPARGAISLMHTWQVTVKLGDGSTREMEYFLDDTESLTDYVRKVVDTYADVISVEIIKQKC